MKNNNSINLKGEKASSEYQPYINVKPNIVLTINVNVLYI